MSKPSVKATPLEPTPTNWLERKDESLVEIQSPFDLVTSTDDRTSISERRQRRNIAHALATCVREARHNSVGTQVVAAKAWGRSQSQVSRLEADPSTAQVGTLIDYLASMNVEFSIRFNTATSFVELRITNDDLVQLSRTQLVGKP
jgi:hypothetical protein